MGATKFSRMDALHHNGKAASISADTFAQTHGGLQKAVESHEHSIAGLVANFTNLEQQVKAIARVMASQKVDKLADNIKMSQEDLQRSMMQYVNDKQKDIMAQVEREVSEVVDAKTGLGKKIDAVEAHLTQTFAAKMEEASAMRFAMREELERIKDMMDSVPGLADKNSKLIKQIDTKVADLKNEFRTFEREHERANIEQDKEVASLAQEIRSALETAKDKLAEETKSLTKSIRKHESMMDDKIKSLTDMIEKESKERMEAGKTYPLMINDTAASIKVELERKVQGLESDIERKVKPCFSGITDVKRLIDEEKVHRETADQELARSIAKEAKDRNHDEERLLSLISQCQTTVSKMHKM
eukprot:TRINITY_DN3711_c0_g1_i1.p1 TRINITY_DN3711_c0_g1~~TRINITY_DN3711_c0_g1_i1.p1  ORF type:complete len:389 (+),score=110.99 TRINITY_DN3711_c0_g1_i1:94-1167(+)